MQPAKRTNSKARRENGFSVMGRDVKSQLMRWDDAIRAFIDDTKYKLKHLPQTNFELGQKFGAEGRLDDALFRFKMATYFAPNFTQAWYNLGCCLIAKEKPAKAIAAFKRTLQLDPAHLDAKFMLATIDDTLLAPQDRPLRMPTHMVEGFFAKVATQYDMIEGANGYEGPQHFHKRVRQLLGRAPERILDVGCGTGLAAMPWRAEAKEIVGVDVTPQMVERSQLARIAGVEVYAQVLTMDANKAQASFPLPEYDVVIALNVLPYMGECSAFITNAARVLKQDGLLAVTFDALPSGKGFGVLPVTSRFGHGVEYMKQLAQAAGLTLAAQDTLQLYLESKTLMLVFSKAKA